MTYTTSAYGVPLSTRRMPVTTWPKVWPSVPLAKPSTRETGGWAPARVRAATSATVPLAVRLAFSAGSVPPDLSASIMAVVDNHPSAKITWSPVPRVIWVPGLLLWVRRRLIPDRLAVKSARVPATKIRSVLPSEAVKSTLKPWPTYTLSTSDDPRKTTVCPCRLASG